MTNVLVLGAGLMGASIGLAAREAGWTVRIRDVDDQSSQRSSALTGLDVAIDNFEPEIVVVATPPSTTASSIRQAIQLYPKSTVIDVASIKNELLLEVESFLDNNVQYVPTHPMAGRSVSGAENARVDLFLDRRWVICPRPNNSPESLALVEQFVRDCGALPVFMDAQLHDRAVALTSHLPQILSTLLATELDRLSDEELGVSGPGLRDMTRLASSDSSLWTEIVLSNNRFINDMLSSFIGKATEFSQSLVRSSAEEVAATFEAGNRQRNRLPGKHGESPQAYEVVSVMIDDKPGQLAGIFECAGKAQINIEDVRIDHALGRETAIVELSIKPDKVKAIQNALVADGWTVRDSSAAR